MLLIFLCFFSQVTTFSQKVDSICFHLYTDSLKIGQHNYINVDGKLNNGRWIPLSSKEIQFTCSEASFEGNELVIPVFFKPEKVTVRAVLKDHPSRWVEKTIWIKTLPDPYLPKPGVLFKNQPHKKNKNPQD